MKKKLLAAAGMAALVLLSWVVSEWIQAAPGERTWIAPTDPVDPAGTEIRAVMQYDGRVALDPDSLTDHWSECASWGDQITPAQPGEPESFTVPALPGGIWYFAIRSIDSAGNVSPMSNIVVERVDRTPPPAINLN